MRNVEINITRQAQDAIITNCQSIINERREECYNNLREEAGMLGNETLKNEMRYLHAINPRKELAYAIGHLAAWALPDDESSKPFTKCTIHCADQGERAMPELVGVYASEDGERTYVIGAVWHGDHWGFHS